MDNMNYKTKSYKDVLDHYDKKHSGLKQLHKNMYSLLNSFNKVINDIDIKPIASAGSLIGAMRHSAIIPWDDDLDFYIRYEDIKKLIKNKSSLDKLGLKLIKPTTKLGRWPIWKLVSKNKDDNAFIDLIVVMQTKVNRRIKFWSMMFSAVVVRAETPFKNKVLKGMVSFLSNPFTMIIPRTPFYWMIVRSSNKSKGSNWYPVFIFDSLWKFKNDYIDADAFDNIKWADFGTSKILVSDNSDKILTRVFGDWKKLPDNHMNQKLLHLNEWRK